MSQEGQLQVTGRKRDVISLAKRACGWKFRLPGSQLDAPWRRHIALRWGKALAHLTQPVSQPLCWTLQLVCGASIRPPHVFCTQACVPLPPACHRAPWRPSLITLKCTLPLSLRHMPMLCLRDSTVTLNSFTVSASLCITQLPHEEVRSKRSGAGELWPLCA